MTTKRPSKLKMLYLAEVAGYKLHDRKEDETIYNPRTQPRYELWKDGKIVSFGDSLSAVKENCSRQGINLFAGI